MQILRPMFSVIIVPLSKNRRSNQLPHIISSVVLSIDRVPDIDYIDIFLRMTPSSIFKIAALKVKGKVLEMHFAS